MSNLGTIKKVIWSFDAFEDKVSLQSNVASVLSVFQGKAFVQIEPVSQCRFPVQVVPDFKVICFNNVKTFSGSQFCVIPGLWFHCIPD